jgi:hypothetical protein
MAEDLRQHPRAPKSKLPWAARRDFPPDEIDGALQALQASLNELEVTPAP